MPPPQLDFKVYVEAAVREVGTVVNTLKEKGAKRFGRTFVMTGVMLFGTYAGLYLPPQKKSARLQAQIDHAKVMADYGDKYEDLRSQLNQAYASLPSVTDRDQWLSNSVRDSLLVSGLAPESFTQVKEEEDSGLIFQVSSVSMDLRFSDFYDWLLRIENAKPLMHMQNVTLTKNGARLGFNNAQCDISTVIPLKRFR